MTPEQWYHKLKQIEAQRADHDGKMHGCSFPSKRKLRAAHRGDIKVGQVFYYSEKIEPYWMIVEEILNVDSEFKAFVAHDGCRYGISGAFVRR
jgi:hypothetical protein